MDKFSIETKKVIARANEEAKRLRHRLIDPEHLLLAIAKSPECRAYRILERMGISPAQIYRTVEEYLGVGEQHTGHEVAQNFSVRTREVLEVAYEEMRRFREDHITTVHLLVAILKSRTKASQILKAQGLYMNDVRQLARAIDPHGELEGEEEERHHEETPALDRFGEDLTRKAREGKLDPVIGRHKEIERVIEVLTKRLKNNPVLVGDPGVGKTAIVEGLALRIAEGRVPQILRNKRIIALDLAAIVAGTKYRGEFEERIKRILQEIRNAKGQIIIFIDEIHTLIGAGAAEGAIDASNILKPALARGELRCIGATTLTEYRKYIEKNPALERRFQMILVEEPTPQETLQILKGLRDRYEKHHGVKITDEALEAAVDLSRRYITERFLPDKAIDLIDESASHVQIKATSPSSEMEEIRERIQALEEEKRHAVLARDLERATWLRDEIKKLRQELQRLEEKHNKYRNLVVTPEIVAEVVERWSGVPVTEMTHSERQRFLNIEKELSRYVIGQEEAISILGRALRRSRAGLKSERRPTGVFLFLGPTGVGKTELARALARVVFGSEQALLRYDMSEYMERFAVTRLIGAPPGYVGYEEGGQLTEAVRRRGYSVVLFDEIEKAHPEVHNILLQIFEEGQLTDGQGRKVDFRNTIIIMTGNVGTQQFSGERIGFRREDITEEISYEKLKNQVLDEVRRSFRPELLARIDETVVFRPLRLEHIVQIVDIFLDQLNQRLKRKHLHLLLTPDAKKFIAEQGFSPREGARPLRRAFERLVEEPLSELLLKAEDSLKGATSILGELEGESLRFRPLRARKLTLEPT